MIVGKSYNYHGGSPQSVNITGFIHNIHRISLWFLQPFFVTNAGFPCRDPAIPSPRSFAVCWHFIAVMGVVDNLGLYSAGFKETKVIGIRKSTAMISINFSFLEQNISKPFHAYLAWHRHQVHICNNLLKYDEVTDLLLTDAKFEYDPHFSHAETNVLILHDQPSLYYLLRILLV